MNDPRTRPVHPTRLAGALTLFAALALLATGCVVPAEEGELADQRHLSGEGGPCATSADCDFALRCLSRRADRVCVMPCGSSLECNSGQCNPVAGSNLGWCHLDETDPWVDNGNGGAPPGGGGNGGGAPAPPEDNGGGAPRPPGDDPADDPDDGGWVDDDPSEPQDDPQDNPPQDNGGQDEPPPSNPQPDPEPDPEPCTYPQAGGSLSRNQVAPAFSWQGAYKSDGSTTSFSMEDFHCNAAYDDRSVIVMIISAGWCSACPDYIRRVNSQASQIQAAGGELIYVEVEDNSYRPAGHSSANQLINRLIGSGPGLRIGDADTRPASRGIYNSPIIQAFPQALVIRRSDMRVVADQNSSNYTLDFVSLAREHGGQNNPGPGPGGACTEESYEPNNSPSQAATIGAGTFSGGVCDSTGDYFRVNINGGWRMDLSFRHSDGDIDVYVWDEARNQPMTVGGQRVGSESATDNESFSHFGPALVRVLGYEGAQAPYTLTLTAQ